MDRTVGGAWNSVFGNTRFNQIRVGYTYEKNGFTAKELQQDPPIPMTQLPPTLTMLTFVDGTRNAAQFRIDNAYEISETFTQFVPPVDGRRERSQVRRARSSTRRSSCPIRPT